MTLIPVVIKPVFGNTAGNIANYGPGTSNGDFVYFYSVASNSIIQRKSDGSAKKVIYELPNQFGVSHLNVMGNQLLFLNKTIHSIKIDGTGLKVVVPDITAGFMLTIGEWIYYLESVDNSSTIGRLCKIKPDGTQRTVISGDSMNRPNSDGIWVYYVNFSDNQKLYKMKMDGSSRTKILDEKISSMILDGDWLYYRPSGVSGLFKVKIDGTGRKQVTSDPVYHFNISEGWVIYSRSDDDYKLYRIRLDGTTKSKISDDRFYRYSYFCAGGWVYFRSDLDNYKVYRIKLDGTGKMVFE